MSVRTVQLGPAELVIDDALWPPAPQSITPCAPSRLAFAAAHVVVKDGYAESGHSLESPANHDELCEWIDWDQTMAARRWLASRGFGIAEAMDTAQRFMLGWPAAKRLIQETSALDLPHGFVAGAGTDHTRVTKRTDLIDAVAYQCGVITRAGGVPVVLPVAWLCENNATEAEFVSLYRDLFNQIEGPVLLHWLGPMFVPQLAGYFPGDSFETILRIDPGKVRGAKLSMLDDELEIRLRRSMLGRDQIMLTGDDFNFAPLIAGDDGPTRLVPLGDRRVPIGDFSHALLGIFDAIAAPAGLALRHLAAGDRETYSGIMAPCQELSRIIFEAPTRHYKAALALLAYLDGRQSNPMLINREDLARDTDHYRRVIAAAARAGVFTDAQTAAGRISEWAACRSPAP